MTQMLDCHASLAMTQREGNSHHFTLRGCHVASLAMTDGEGDSHHFTLRGCHVASLAMTQRKLSEHDLDFFPFSPFFFFNILLSVDIHIFEIYPPINFMMRNPGKTEW